MTNIRNELRIIRKNKKLSLQKVAKEKAKRNNTEVRAVILKKFIQIIYFNFMKQTLKEFIFKKMEI